MKMHPFTTVYRTNVVADAAGHNVLRLPIAHCKLNPIELVWAQVKCYAARHNKKITMVEAVNLCNEGIAAITMENWAACVKHVVDKVEPRFWEQDHLIKQTIDEFVIHIGPESDDKEDKSMDEHGCTAV